VVNLVRAPLSCALADDLRGAVAVIGNLDGVHKGHQALLDAARGLADELNAPLAAVTFEPHPRLVFQPEAPPFILTPLGIKAELLGRFGADRVFALPFNETFYTLTPEAFVTNVLKETLGLRGVVTGSDFQFGAGRSGTSETLARIAGEIGLRYEAITPVGGGELKYSSSDARSALREGRPGDAAKVLGYSWFTEGEVCEGRKLARTLGFPTANISLGKVIRPLYGVYAIEAELDGQRFPAIANMGVRPTVDGTEERLEVHLFDWDGALYGKTLRCHFAHFIREERRMDGLDALKAQITADSTEARRFFGLSAA
jgi:riboflavin kinase/FMN adenylyltransferase